MAFRMSKDPDDRLPFDFITNLIQMGHARFLPSDPDGLFVKWAREAYRRLPEWGIHYVMEFLCPSETTDKVMRIAGGLLAPGEEASGQLCRLVQSFDSETKMNIMHLFVKYGIGRCDTKGFLQKLRMLRHVYGLSVLTPTQHGLSLLQNRTENTRTCEKCTRNACNSRMSVCFLTRSTCKKVRQNLIPLATAYCAGSSVALIQRVR